MKNPDDSQSPRLEQPPLFETPADPAGQAPPSEAPSSSGCPRLRPANRQQIVFRTASLDELIPLDHPSRIVWDYVEGLDLSPLCDRIKAVERAPGRAPIDPKILVALWLYVAVHRCSSSCFAEAFAREYGHQWTTIGVSGYSSWLVSTSRSLIRCSRRGCRRHRRTHFRTSRSLQTLHPSTPPALRSLRLPATVMAARCQRTTPQLPPPSTQTPIALAVCKSRSLSRSVRTSGFPFHSLYPA